MTTVIDDSFDRFWRAYPRRVAKAAARRAWGKLNPSPALVDQILVALLWQSVQPDWLKQGGMYCPHPASWLNGERWDDEPPALMPMNKASASIASALSQDVRYDS